MQSATKYLNGHSDVTGGVVTGHEGAARADREGAAAGRHGDGSASGVRARPRAEDAAAPRRAAQRERARGRRLSRGTTAASARSTTPGLPSHPDHEIARRQMSGFGGMVCFDLDGRYDRAERFYDRLKIIKRAASLGGVESLISMPVLTSQWGHTDEQLRAAGVTKGMLQALGRARGRRGSDRRPRSGARELRIKNLELGIRELRREFRWIATNRARILQF